MLMFINYSIYMVQNSQHFKFRMTVQTSLESCLH